jgi:transcriptional regulator with XRE-family HTH domain
MDELADRSGVSKPTISRIETGEVTNPSNDTVSKLKLALPLKRRTLVFGQVMEKAS